MKEDSLVNDLVPVGLDRLALELKVNFPEGGNIERARASVRHIRLQQRIQHPATPERRNQGSQIAKGRHPTRAQGRCPERAAKASPPSRGNSIAFPDGPVTCYSTWSELA